MIEACVYCGGVPGDSRDHVPPQNLLRKPFRLNLRTVPACGKCNNGFSRDEEYFRRMLVTFFGASPEADELFDGPVTRSLVRSPRLEDSLWNSLHHERHRVFVDLDVDAVRRVVEKIVRGLSYLRSGSRLDAKASFGLALYERSDRPRAVKTALKDVAPNFDDGPNFSFHVVDKPDVHHETLWELCFFDAFCCAVGVRTGA